MGTALLALALTANPALEAAEEHLRALRYEEALPLLLVATRAPAQSPSERRRSAGLLAHARAAVGDLEGAVEAYEALLAVDPHAPPPRDAAPKLRRAFAQARQRARASRDAPSAPAALAVGAPSALPPAPAAPAGAPSFATPVAPPVGAPLAARGAPAEPSRPLEPSSPRPSRLPAPPILASDGAPVPLAVVGAAHVAPAGDRAASARTVAAWSAGVAAVAAAMGVGVGLSAQADGRSVARATVGGESRLLHRELEALVQRQHLEAQVANGSFAVAAAAAVTAGVAALLSVSAAGVATPPGVAWGPPP